MQLQNKQLLIVTSEFPPQPGGIGNHAYQLALELSKNDYSITVIADQRSTLGEEEAVFDKTLPFKVIRIKRHKQRFKMYLNRIVVTYKNFSKASHVIATGKFSLWNVAFISRFKKAKTIAVVHGTEVNFKSFILKKSIDYSLNKMDSIVAVSRYTKSLISYLNKDVEVIPNGIRANEWNSDGRNSITLKGNPVLTTIGRVSSRKGQLNVIKHLPELLKHYPDLHYHCVGIPTESDYFTQVAIDLGVNSHITFHGALDDEQLKQVLSSTTIFVMLSSESKTGDVEGFGIAILEANALGVPAIGSKNCGIEDAIKPNVSGVLIDSSDTSQFLKAIDSILKSKDTFSEASTDWALAHNWSTIIKHYIALLA